MRYYHKLCGEEMKIFNYLKTSTIYVECPHCVPELNPKYRYTYLIDDDSAGFYKEFVETELERFDKSLEKILK